MKQNLVSACCLAFSVVAAWGSDFPRDLVFGGYEARFHASDVVVIARPISRVELKSATLPGGIRIRPGEDGEPESISAVQVATRFKADISLKGDLADDERSFTLIHFVAPGVHPAWKKLSRGEFGKTGAHLTGEWDGILRPMLVDFVPGSGDYLMFLKQSEGEWYEAVTGPLYAAPAINRLEGGSMMRVGWTEYQMPLPDTIHPSPSN